MFHGVGNHYISLNYCSWGMLRHHFSIFCVCARTCKPLGLESLEALFLRRKRVSCIAAAGLQWCRCKLSERSTEHDAVWPWKEGEWFGADWLNPFLAIFDMLGYAGSGTGLNFVKVVPVLRQQLRWFEMHLLSTSGLPFVVSLHRAPMVPCYCQFVWRLCSSRCTR